MSNTTPITLSFDPITSIVTCGVKSIELTSIESAIFEYTLGHSAVMIPRVDLIVHAWKDPANSTKTTYDETIRRLIRRFENELGLQDKLLVYRRGTLVLRLAPEVAAKVLVHGLLNIIPGSEAAPPVDDAEPSEELSYARKVEIDTMAELYSLDVDLPNVTDATDILFLAWYVRIAELVGVPNPHSAYYEGRFGPAHLLVNSDDWRFVMGVLLTRVIESFPKEMKQLGSNTEAGADLRFLFMSTIEDWRPLVTRASIGMNKVEVYSMVKFGDVSPDVAKAKSSRKESARKAQELMKRIVECEELAT